MVFTIEPGVYDSEVGGFRHSDTVAVTEDGIEILTDYPRGPREPDDPRLSAMDFELGEDLALFQQETRAWVDREAPEELGARARAERGGVAVRALRQVHAGGLPRRRDRRGVRRPGRQRPRPDDPRARARAEPRRPRRGSGGSPRSPAARASGSTAPTTRRSASCRRSRAASCASRSASPSPAAAPTCSAACARPRAQGGRRLAREREQDVVLGGAHRALHPPPRADRRRRGEAPPGPHALPAPDRRRGRHDRRHPEARDARARLLRRRPPGRLRPGRARARGARRGLVHAPADAQQRADHPLLVLLRDPRRRPRGRARVRRRARGVRPEDRRVPGAAALPRGHRDVAPSGGPRRAARRVAPGHRPAVLPGDDDGEGRRVRVRPSGRPTSGSRSSAGWATRPRPTCSGTGATRASSGSGRSRTRWRATRSPRTSACRARSSRVSGPSRPIASARRCAAPP